jgi:hypothetical protein
VCIREGFKDRDLALVSGTLEAARYSIFVNHHREAATAISFKVHDTAEVGVWGSWETAFGFTRQNSSAGKLDNMRRGA